MSHQLLLNKLKQRSSYNNLNIHSCIVSYVSETFEIFIALQRLWALASTSFFHLLSFSFLSDYQLLHGELPHHAVAKDNTDLIMVYDCVGHDFRLVILCFPWCRLGWLGGAHLGAGLVRTIPGWLHSHTWSLGKVSCMAGLNQTPRTPWSLQQSSSALLHGCSGQQGTKAEVPSSLKV